MVKRYINNESVALKEEDTESCDKINGAFSSKPRKLLTTREREVLDLILKGLGNKEIAGHMTISPSTIETYLKNIFFKFGVTNRTSAAIKYLAIKSFCISRKVIHEGLNLS